MVLVRLTEGPPRLGNLAVGFSRHKYPGFDLGKPHGGSGVHGSLQVPKNLHRGSARFEERKKKFKKLQTGEAIPWLWQGLRCPEKPRAP